MDQASLEQIMKWAQLPALIGLLSLLIGIIIYLIRSVQKGSWVPGYLYLRKCADLDASLAREQKLTDLLAAAVKNQESFAESVERLTDFNHRRGGRGVRS